MISFVSPFRFTFFFLLAPAIAAGQAPAEIRPLLDKYCLACHSAAKHTGDVNLERFEPRVWQKAAEQLQLLEMPPKGMPQPTADERAHMQRVVHDALMVVARAQAGDPGPVVLRRLNNAEYTYTIRDLTGVASLDPAKEFPVDGAAGEGFTNTGNSLGMSPTLVTKYLDAGKVIASHAVLLRDGIRFAPGVSRRDWTDETLANIRAFYQKYTEMGGTETVLQQGMALDKNRGGSLPLKKYLTASLALRGPSTPAAINRVAQQNGLSPKYLTTLVTLMKSTHPSPLLDGMRARWRTAKPGDIDAMVSEIAEWQSTLWKFSSIGHIGKVNGPKAWMEPVDPVASQQEFRVKLAAPADATDVTVYLAARDAGDGKVGDSVVWREPKLAIKGRSPVLLRDLPAFIEELSARRARILGATATSLENTGADPEARAAWFEFLGVNATQDFTLDLLKAKIEKTATYDFVKGWGSTETPLLLANSSDQHVRVPGNMKPHSVAVHPSQKLITAVGWRSPLNSTVQVQGTITRAHAECGTGITWSVELRRGRTRQRLAEGEATGAKPKPFGPIERVRVQPGDLISVLIGAREDNNFCGLTDVDFRLSTTGAEPQKWSLAGDVSGNVLAANPNGVWHFYTEPMVGTDGDTMLPAGSLLARWQAADSDDERRQLAQDLQKLLSATPPSATDKSADAALYRQLTSLGGPLFAGSISVASAKGNRSAWGLDPALFDNSGSVRVHAPSIVAVRLPGDLVTNSEFVTTGALDTATGAEGSVQLEVLTTKPDPRTGLLPSGTKVGVAKGTWSSNNEVVSYAMPVVVNENSVARKRVEAAFEEFRQTFPAALCYTKIVPVDEVVTLTLFHREDDHLSRLILNDKEKAHLDRMWDDLHYISRDAIQMVDAFEQLWQYATQDADPSAFEPLRKPIQDRAASFRQVLAETEPRHIDAVLEFADRAYRRPLTGGEKDQLWSLYTQLRGQGLPHEDSVRLMLARVLVSPAFLYRAEPAPPGKRATPVGDYDIANRLSYFLWSSTPDAELRDAAASGKLRTPAGLEAQTRRMLRDDRVSRMGTEFGAAWLHLLGFDSLDEKSDRHFPAFRDLRGPMFEETTRFITDIFHNNGSILNLLDADYTFLNEALAKHYGIPGVTGTEMRRVDGIHKYSRGGVVGQASVLSKASGASRTSPILRGDWITDVLLGERLPRPPQGVPQLPAEEAGLTLSVREMIEKHTADSRCSVCHSRIDPYGFSLERFDAIGAHRDKDVADRPINDHSTLKDGTDLPGFEGLRNYLLTKGKEPFVHQFCKKLLGYSLGRAVQLSDEPLLTEMQTRLSSSGYHVNTAIDLIVASPQFREIRGRDYEEEHE